MEQKFDGISAREGKLKNAIELRDSCNGFTPRNGNLPQANCKPKFVVEPYEIDYFFDIRTQ